MASEDFSNMTGHRQNSFSIDLVDFPYRELPSNFKIPVRMQSKGYCLNRRCKFIVTTIKRLVECPKCSHMLFWTHKEGVYKK